MPNATDADAAPPGTISAMAWRTLPLLGVAYLFAYMDRVNVSFAALQMNADLGFSATVYGLGSGLFFLAYAMFEVPSNMICAKVGARRWIARIMITWGVLAAGTMFVQTAWQFYLIRFLLGAAEAGFFPGLIWYIAHWFPKAVRGRALSLIYILGALAGVVIGQLSPWLLALDGFKDLHGWQWLFLVEGLPAAFIGLLVLVFLPDAPERVRWLNAEQKAWVAGALAKDAEAHGTPDAHGVIAALAHPQVWRLGLFGFLTIGTAMTFALSAPQVVQAATGLDTFYVGQLASLAGVLGALGIVMAGVISDRRGERFSTMAVSIAIVGLCYAVMAVSLEGQATLFISAYLVFGFATWAVSFGNLMNWPDLLPKHLLAVGGAAINTVSQIGAFLMPYAWGAAQDATGGFQTGLIGLAIGAGLSVLVALMARAEARRPRLETVPA